MFPFFYFGVLCAHYENVKNLLCNTEWIFTISLVFYAVPMFCLGALVNLLDVLPLQS